MNEKKREKISVLFNCIFLCVGFSVLFTLLFTALGVSTKISLIVSLISIFVIGGYVNYKERCRWNSGEYAIMRD